MVTPESIHELLAAAQANLGAALSQIAESRFEPVGAHMSRVAKAQAAIAEIQREIHRLRPDLVPAHQDVSDKADFVGLSPRLLSIGLSP